MRDLLDHPAAIRPGEELNLVRLEPYLRRQFPSDVGEFRVRQFLSGHSNLTYSLRLGARELVLRRPPFGSKVKSAHDMSREFRVLSKLHSVYSPAPEVLLYCDDDSVIGAPFYVMNPIHGIILRSHVPPGLDFPAETLLGRGPLRSGQTRRLSGKADQRVDRALLRIQNARLSRSAENLRVDTAAHAFHERRFADSQ